MKRINHFLLFTALLFVSGLYSCSNDKFESPIITSSQEKLSSEMDNDSVIVVSSYEELFKAFGIEPVKVEPKVMLRGTMDVWDLTAYGYDNISTSSRIKTMFSKDLANLLGLSYTKIYFCYNKTVTKNITIPTPRSFFENTSPNCGYLPNSNSFTFNQRGYSTSSGSSNSTKLTTYVFYVEYDVWGGYVKKHYPCAPEQIIWNYILC